MNHKWKWLTSHTPQTAQDAAPIVVPTSTGDPAYGNHLRHLAGHAGTMPLTLDEYGRCIACLRLGCFRLNA